MNEARALVTPLARWLTSCILAAGLSSTALAAAVQESSGERAADASSAHHASAPGDRSRSTKFRLPLMLEENRGQAGAAGDFVGRARDHVFFLRAGEIAFALPGVGSGSDMPTLRFAGADPLSTGKGLERAITRVNYLRGGDPARWRTGIRTYRSVRYSNLYPGIDALFYVNGSRLEYDLILLPGADPGAVALAPEGFSRVSVNARGELLLEAGSGALVQHAPRVYQVIDGAQHEVSAGYELRQDGRVGFRLGRFDHTLALVIDPIIEFSTAFGGEKKEQAFSVATDAAGDVWLVGTTDSDDLPLELAEAPPWQGERAGKHDAFLAHFSADGTTLHSATYFGGSASDRATGVAITAAGDVVVVGYTDSDDFPIVNAAQAVRGGKKDMFVSRFNDDGSMLLGSTYLGGHKDERAGAVAADALGNVFVAGYTRSEPAPTVPEDPDGLAGKRDALVARIDASGAIGFSVLFGGHKDDEATGIGIGASGDPVVVGSTKSIDFPMVDAVQPFYGGGSRDAFVMRLDAATGAILYSTYLGGDRADEARAVAVDGEDATVVVGMTESKDDFPLVDATQIAFGGQSDAFATRLSADGSVIEYSTYLGGKKKDTAYAVAIDGDDAAHVVGETSSKDDFAQIAPVQPGYGGGKSDAFVVKLRRDGARVHSSFLGGPKDDQAQGVAAASSRAIYVAGATKSENGKSKKSKKTSPGGTPDPLAGGKEDAFLTKIVYDPPTLEFLEPLEDATLEDDTVEFNVAFAAGEAELDLDSFMLLSNGVDVTEFTTLTETGASYTQVLPDGANTATASIADVTGLSTSQTVNFEVEATVFRAIAECAPSAGAVPLTVRFRARGEFSSGSIVRYRWDLDGNGSFDTSDAVARDYIRTYNQQGTVDAVLQVTNNLGETATDSCRIVVAGNPPTASASASPSNGPIPLDVDFTCTGTDADGVIVLYEWDFEGDGSFDFSSPDSGAVSHTYAIEGTYVAVCRVTDDDGSSAEARTTTTIIRPAPPGSPSVTATVAPGAGNAPLSAQFGGSATDDGTIVLWEWDFDGDGSFEFASPTSPVTTFQYTAGGIFGAALRATDNEGKTGTDTVEVVVNVNVGLSILDDTLELVPGNPGATARVRTTLSAALPVRISMKNASGDTVRVLVDATRVAGTYDDPWDGRDDAGEVLPQGSYYAVIEYIFGGETRIVDLTNSTGGARSNPPRSRIPRTFAPFAGNPLTITYTLNRAAEVTAFIGRFRVDTRLVTFFERLPMGRGTHTLTWNGENAQGQLIHPPPGDSFLFGIWQYTLPSNAIFLHSGAEVTGLGAAPSIFDPAAVVDDQGTPSRSAVTFALSNAADVDLTVDDAVTGVRVARLIYPGLTAGANTIEWDGRDEQGVLVAPGRYRLGVAATDSTGFQSVRVFVLQRVFY